MKVLLISSGEGTWPNNGWGAVENIVADFSWALEQLGAEVRIYHQKEFGEQFFSVFRDFSPDVVHCEYDDHILHLLPLLKEYPSTKVLLTTHYAYLSQPYKLVQDGYMHRFLFACNCAIQLNLTLAVLSEEIAQTYEKLGGVPRSKLWIFPNGTRTDRIICKPPIFPDKAICVGKIETRKRQAFLQSACTSIDFVGPITDDSFIKTTSYRGSWTRNELYQNLTEYPCLILLSEAEAHPLVIGEALAAGCSIVCSEIAAANLPREKPWIKVIKSTASPQEIHSAVSEMCKVGCQSRNEIREWACTHLDWKLRANQFLQTWSPTQTLQISKPSPLRFALIGPGIMPIPPTGWGAVEQLIWDHATQLRSKGHSVDIINTANQDEIVQKVNEGSFDVVHIHYDVFAHLAEHMTAKCILLTSHYPYIDNHEKWSRDGFGKTFQTMCLLAQAPNTYIFALCEKDKDVFSKMGGLSQKVFLMPNGVDVKAFDFKETAHFADRSVVLAKIEPRKRQHLTYWFSDVDYIGRGEFHHPNFRGELSHELLYRVLTDFGNLVLLSEGEASSLAIKEAFAAGLGCVLSTSAANEYKEKLPWITIVPEEDLCKVEKLHELIHQNRSLSLAMRKQIREWTLKTWDWSVVLDQYVSNVKLILEKCC